MEHWLLITKIWLERLAAMARKLDGALSVDGKISNVKNELSERIRG